ncbi:MAG TPA: DUF6711 family protein [Tissierellaceae bacterium]|nr:DUF6711 family protein [Tissierellaceae bacterium]
MLTINGVKMPDPSVYKISRQDLDSENSGRNERGVIIRDRLRQGILKAEYEYWAIDNEKVNKLLNAIKPEKVSVTLLVEGSYVTKEMYVGDRSSEMVRFMNRLDKMAWNVSFNLVEC